MCLQQTGSSKNLTDEQRSRETAGKSDGKATATSSEALLPAAKDARRSKVEPKSSKETTEGGGTSKAREFVVGQLHKTNFKNNTDLRKDNEYSNYQPSLVNLTEKQNKVTQIFT